MNGRSTGWRGWIKADGRGWKGTSVDGGNVCHGQVRSHRAALKSKAVLSSMISLYSSLHGKYLQCIIGEKLSTQASQPLVLY